jgi:hypothetical protein
LALAWPVTQPKSTNAGSTASNESRWSRPLRRHGLTRIYPCSWA